MIDGGVVLSSLQSETNPRRVAVTGVWSGGRFDGSSRISVQHFHAGALRGLWTLKGAQLSPGMDAVLILEARASKRPPEIQSGDVLVFGPGRHKNLSATGTQISMDSDIAVQYESGHHGIAHFQNGQLSSLSFFASHEDQFSVSSDVFFSFRGREYSAQITDPRYIGPPLPLEICLPDDAPPLHQLLRTASPVRDFLLEAGQEMLLHARRPPNGVRKRITYEAFEPTVSLSPGSIRLHLRPPQVAQMSLFVRPQDPYFLLVDTLRAAIAGDRKLLLSQLGDSVFSTDFFLRKVLDIIKPTKRYGPFSIRIGDAEPLVLKPDLLPFIALCISDSKPRDIERAGTLYAVDIRRRWCRLLVSQTDQDEDWTLRFDPELIKDVRGELPRDIVAHFTTTSDASLGRGTGVLTSIQEVAQET